jgi:hypothetical protein
LERAAATAAEITKIQNDMYFPLVELEIWFNGVEIGI